MSLPEEPLNDSALSYLLSAYFHQDWDIEGPDAEAVLERFVESEATTTIEGARDGAARLLEKELSEADLEEYVRSLGCYYLPSFHGMSYAEWLRMITNRLTRSLADQG